MQNVLSYWEAYKTCRMFYSYVTFHAIILCKENQNKICLRSVKIYFLKFLYPYLSLNCCLAVSIQKVLLINSTSIALQDMNSGLLI